MIGFEVFFYKCAGHKSHPDFDDWFTRFLELPNLSSQDRTILQYTLDCSAVGIYPPWDYYSRYYSAPDHQYNLGELGVAFLDISDMYRRMALMGTVTAAGTESLRFKDYREELKKAIAATEDEVSDLSDIKFTKWDFAEEVKRPYTEGIKLGVPEIDDLTNGFQSSTIASICAYTGQGKSTLCLSSLYKAARSGRKCLYVSLELDPNIVWLMFQTRFLYEEKGLSVNSQDLIFHKLSGDKQAAVLASNDEFHKLVGDNITILDLSTFTKGVFMDPSKIIAVYEATSKYLGGLDIICYDHITQLNALFVERGQSLGNTIIVNLRAAGLSYTNQANVHPVTIFAVQCNRQGFTRAGRRNGQYDLMSISDLNEIERSSTYCIFLYTPPDLADAQETRVCMLKHRLGRVLPEPVTTQFLPGVLLVGSNVENISYEDEFAAISDGGGVFGGGGSDLMGDLVGSL